MISALEYAEEHGRRFREELEHLTRIPSISTDPQHSEDIQAAAEWLAENLRSIGFHSAEVSPSDGHPVVYGEWLGAGDDAPTVLLYAHYDVQPAVKSDGWDTDPFVPTEQDGRIYARGIGDDKLHTIMILKTAESFLKSDEGCPVNLKVVIEGEEEVGSRNFAPWVRKHRDRLGADYCLVCDGSMADIDEPTINYALRGMLAMEFTVRGPKADLHSGTHGGRVHNPAQVVAEMVSKLHDESGRVAVPGFYDDVYDLSDEERAEINKAEMSIEEFEQSVGAPKPWGEVEYSLTERATSRPTLEINGIYGGYTGKGIKTVIPAQASAKISCRLVNDQRPDSVYEQIVSYLEEIAPETVELSVERQGSADPVIVPADSLLVTALKKAYSHHWDADVRLKRMGGTIPIAPVFKLELDLPTLLVGFNVEYAGFHGPNEFIYIDLFHKGIDTMILLLRELANPEE